MSHDFHENLEQPEAPLPPDRSTGLVFTAIAALIAYLWRSNTAVCYAAGSASVVLITISLLRPIWLRRLNILWMRFALLLSKVVNPLVMLVLFMLVIVPAGLIMRLRHDPLQKKPLPDAKSYWILRGSDDRSDMKNQF